MSSDAEKYRLAQAIELLTCRRLGRNPARDANGKVLPTAAAFAAAEVSEAAAVNISSDQVDPIIQEESDQWANSQPYVLQRRLQKKIGELCEINVLLAKAVGNDEKSS